MRERERERESIQIFGTTKYFAIFLSSFLLSVLNDSATGTTATTPLSYKALFVVVLIFII